MSKTLRFEVIRATAMVAVAGCVLVLGACKNDGTGATGHNGSTAGGDKVMFNANGDPINHAPDTSKHGQWEQAK